MADRRDRASELFGMGGKQEESEESKREVSVTASTDSAENASSTAEEPDSETLEQIDSTDEVEANPSDAPSELSDKISDENGDVASDPIAPIKDDQMAADEASSEPVVVGDDVEPQDHGEAPNVQDVRQKAAYDARDEAETPAADDVEDTESTPPGGRSTSDIYGFPSRASQGHRVTPNESESYADEPEPHVEPERPRSTSPVQDARSTSPIQDNQEDKTPTTTSWGSLKVQIRVVGCGQCGSQIAGTFLLDKPDYVPSRREEFYPIKSVAFDTDESITEVLARNWDWQRRDHIFILPMPSAQYLTDRLLQGKDFTPQQQSRAVLFAQEQQGGVGGLPFLGRLAAESALTSETSFVQSSHFQLRQDIRDQLIAAEFRSGVLLICNSLTGGTGTGFSPVVTTFMREKVGFSADLTLNLSILPSESETAEEKYPSSILASLHSLLVSQKETGGIVDSVIVIDNDALARLCPPNKRPGFATFNQMIRDMITPLLLAPVGRYNVPDLTSSLDTADIKRWIRGGAGFDKPEISTLAYATLPVKEFMTGIVGRFSGRKVISRKLRQGLDRLADLALSQYVLGKDERPRAETGGVAILFGPPSFFEKVDITDIDFLTDKLREKIGTTRFRKPDCLRFPSSQFDYVGLTVLVSGIVSPRLEDICVRALGRDEMMKTWDYNATLAENIRAIDEEVVEEMMIGEIREALQLGSQSH